MTRWSRLHPARIVLGILGVMVGTGAVLGLREATLSTHQRVSPASQATLVLDADARGAETGRDLEELVETLLLTCRLEVGRSELVLDDGEAVVESPTRPGRYTAVFEPGLDQTNQRQLRGCLEDWTVDHVRIDVVSISVS